MRSFSSSSALVRIVSIVTTTYSGCNIRDNRKKFVLCSYKWTKSATCSFNNPRCGNRGIKNALGHVSRFIYPLSLSRSVCFLSLSLLFISRSRTSNLHLFSPSRSLSIPLYLSSSIPHSFLLPPPFCTYSLSALVYPSFFNPSLSFL